MAKVVVITGASSGIGAELARQLGRRGDSLVLAARRETELESVADEVRASGGTAVTVRTDVTRRADIEKLRDAALEAFGRVDVWVNNAGQGITRWVLDLTDEDVDSIMAVNLKSALYGMQAIVPYFKERGEGHVINVSSFLGRVPVASFRSVYSAAKAAVNSLSANVRMDLAREYPNVHVSVFMPGIVATEFRNNVLGGAPADWSGVGTGAAGASQNVDEVAALMVQLIENPVPEMFSNPASAGIAQRYFEDVQAFEAGL
jgi:short-subunit dehydrogenase